MNNLLILNISYDQWIDSVTAYPVLTIKTDRFNIFDDSEQLLEIEKKIVERI